MLFVTLFTRLKNVNLTKDVGMIPYVLHRDHGFDCLMVTKKNDENYDYLKDEVAGLQIEFIKGKGFLYLLKNARKIDILNIYHLNLQSWYNSLLFRIIKRKGSLIYLKLDMDDAGYERLMNKDPQGLIKRLTMMHADIISVETKDLYMKLRERYKDKMLFLPNGYYTRADAPERDMKKEDIILTVGNLGTSAKATDTLIKAFHKSSCGYKLHLAGPVAEGFINPCPDDPDIIFEGEIKDREQLRDLYRRAKIFAFPSRHESFGIVLLEAASCGDYIISTKGVPAARDIISLTGEGAITDVDDIDALASEIRTVTSSNRDWDSIAEKIAEKIYDNCRYEDTVRPLYERIISLKEG